MRPRDVPGGFAAASQYDEPMVLERIENVLDPEFVDELEALPMQEVRDRRAEGNALEEILSYVRRVVQARLDIVLAEIGRRDEGADSRAVTVEELPEILSEHGSRAARGALASYGDPAEHSAELLDEVDRVVGVDTLAQLHELPDDRIRWIAGALTQLERKFSDGRRRIHQQLDVLQAEIVRRYKTGAVNVDDVLKSR